MVDGKGIVGEEMEGRVAGGGMEGWVDGMLCNSKVMNNTFNGFLNQRLGT